jgi:hypothetical protein
VAALAGLLAGPATAGRLDCGVLARSGVPRLSLRGREMVQLHLVAQRARFETGLPRNAEAVAPHFARRLRSLAACDGTTALPAEAALSAEVEDGELVLRAAGASRSVRLRGEWLAHAAERSVRWLLECAGGAEAEREDMGRLLWAAWAEAVIDSLEQPFTGYVYADEVAHRRPGEEPPPSVEWLASGGAAYLRVHAFTARTPAELASALAQLRPLAGEGLVLDLRGNRGGHVDPTMVDAFLPLGALLASRRELGGEVVEDVPASRAGWAGPLAVLIDGATGSMAELLATAVQRAGRGPLVGARSFGKAVGQRLHPVGGEGLLVLDAVEYFVPGTRQSWSGIGLEPDLAVEPGRPAAGLEGLELGALARADRALAAALEALGATP